jgi:hypothetical protein
MALQAANAFATYGVTDGAQVRDISDVLADALYYDLHFLGAVDVDFGSPVMDVVHYWNEDALNADTVTLSASAAASATTLSLTTGQGARCHVGDLLVCTVSGLYQVAQITAIATDTLTISPAYNSTAQASYASTATFALIRAESEGSDIGADKSLTPAVKTNYTQIFSAEDIKVTGSQLARRMATVQMQDFIARQLSNRAIETKINLTRAFLYSEKSSSAGSDSVYRTFNGIRGQINAATGITDSSASALSYAILNTNNKSIVNNGVFPDLLVCGTDLVGSIAGIDSSNRRLLESDRQAGYVVQEILLNQGNSVRVVVDPRVNAGDAFLLSSERFHALPMNGRGMFVIAAVDFTDAKKRRVLAEWTCELRNADKAHCYMSAKT